MQNPTQTNPAFPTDLNLKAQPVIQLNEDQSFKIKDPKLSQKALKEKRDKFSEQRRKDFIIFSLVKSCKSYNTEYSFNSLERKCDKLVKTSLLLKISIFVLEKGSYFKGASAVKMNLVLQYNRGQIMTELFIIFILLYCDDQNSFHPHFY